MTASKPTPDGRCWGPGGKTGRGRCGVKLQQGQILYCSRSCNNRAYLRRKGVQLREVPIGATIIPPGEDPPAASRPRRRGKRPDTLYVVLRHVTWENGVHDLEVVGTTKAHDGPSAVRDLAVDDDASYTFAPAVVLERKLDSEGRPAE